jgi:transposase
MSKAKKYSPEVRERSVRMVLDVRKDHPSLWSAVESVAAKIGCTATTLNEWVKRDQINTGVRDGITSARIASYVAPTKY